MNRRLLSVMLMAFVSLPFLAPSASGSLPQPIVKRSSSAIAVTPDGHTLLVVNPDSNSVSMIALPELSLRAEVDVGIDPRTVAIDALGDRAYVACRGSDSVAVVQLRSQQVVGEVAVGMRPYGIVVDPDGEQVYVSEQTMDQIRVLDANTFDTRAVIPTQDAPSGLAISNDGRRLYVTHLLTSQITVIQVRLHNVLLPLLVRAGSGSGRAMSSPGARWSDYPSTSISLWPDSNLVQSIVLSPDGLRAYVPHTRSNSANRAITFDTTVFPLVSLLDLESGKQMIGKQIDLGTLDPPGVGLPFDAAVSRDGATLWVVNAASNDISAVDLDRNRLIAHVEVGDNPRGIVLSPDGETAYVNNTLAGTVSAIDARTYRVLDTEKVTDIPLPPILLNGKRLFHSSDDPRMARAQWISCNTCHFDGEHDGQTWRFGFSGPRNTTSLLGMIETYPLRWSGEWDESADSEFANRKENFGAGLISGEMHCTATPADCVNQPPNQGRSYDLDCLAAFIDSLAIPLSPGHAHGEPLTESEQRGQGVFSDPTLDCITCHPPPLYTDLQKHDVGTATQDERIGPEYDTPSLRGLWQSAPFFHDGSAATLRDALTLPSPNSEHDVRGVLTEEELADLIAFLLALPFGG